MKIKKQNWLSLFGSKGIIFILDAFLAIIIIASLLPFISNTNWFEDSAINRVMALNEFQDIISNLIEQQTIQKTIFGVTVEKSAYWNGVSLIEKNKEKINLADGSINPCIDNTGFEEIELFDGNETFLEVGFEKINLIKIPKQIDLNIIYITEKNNFSNSFIKCFDGSSWINIAPWSNSSDCTDKKEITIKIPNNCINSREKLEKIKIRVGSSDATVNGRLFIDLMRLELDKNVLEEEINNDLSKERDWKLTINIFKKTKEKEKTIVIGKELKETNDIITGKNYFTINAGVLQKIGEMNYELKLSD